MTDHLSTTTPRLHAEINPVTPFQQNCSLIWCSETLRGALVDAGGEPEKLLAAVKRRGVTLEKLLVTHGHLDHAGAVMEIAEQLKLPIEGPHQDDKFWIDGMPAAAQQYGFPPSRSFTPDRWLKDGDTVTVGNLVLDVIHCPGHTPGHVVFYHAPSQAALVGDVLFQGSIGRTDFPKGNHADLIRSIREKLFPLGDEITFVPGHGPLSTFGQERANNPFVSDRALGQGVMPQHITSGRARLAVEILGSGDPVVFLHAAVCDSRMWTAQMQAVSATHMAIAYDRRGYGRTVAEAEDHSAVADLLAVMDGVAGGKPAILVTCSQGGRIALDAALMHPDRIRGLVLISPSVFGAPDPVYPPAIQALIAAQKAAQDAGDLERLNAIKAHLWLDGPLQPEGRVAGPVRDLFLDMNGIVLRAPPVGVSVDSLPNFLRLAGIAAPAQIICGDYDLPTIVERCRHMAATMPRASHHALPGTAHLPSLDKPAEITALVTGFLSRF